MLNTILLGLLQDYPRIFTGLLLHIVAFVINQIVLGIRTKQGGIQMSNSTQSVTITITVDPSNKRAVRRALVKARLYLKQSKMADLIAENAYDIVVTDQLGNKLSDGGAK
jgi:hypothetical protein